VSCHGQVVEGRHISVTETACLTCHFYGRKSNAVAAGECRTCHTTPDHPVKFASTEFDHRDYLEGKPDVKCTQCHSQVTQGQGVVSSTRCQSCHLHRTPEVKDQEEFHLTHVSEGHFDCLQCHDEIRHGKGTLSHQLMAQANCTTCHGERRHSVQERIYAGAPIAGTSGEPDMMFAAGVACDGCHTDVEKVTVGGASYQRRVSGTKQCTTCHNDEFYGEMLAEWQAEVKGQLGEFRSSLTELTDACKTAGDGAPAAKARDLLAAARAKVESIAADGSDGAHNYLYITDLLDQAGDELDECRKLLKPKPETVGMNR
jgi:hypothetical protein